MHWDQSEARMWSQLRQSCSALPVGEQTAPQPLQMAPAKRVQDDVIPEGSFGADSDHSTISCSPCFLSHDSA